MKPAIFVDNRSAKYPKYLKLILNAYNAPVDMDIYIIFYEDHIVYDEIYGEGSENECTLQELIDEKGIQIITPDTLMSKFPQQGREFQSFTSSIGTKGILELFGLKPTTHLDEDDIINHE